ncbi:LGFP repeat-containing protein [Mesorhizobium sp. NPDC059054]|uniref:LGFP repeat-containing protein n=1 Tax=Mesorhizobium sp. NPDC059054 TaxID=3346711 RepID=UPI0036B2AE67
MTRKPRIVVKRFDQTKAFAGKRDEVLAAGFGLGSLVRELRDDHGPVQQDYEGGSLVLGYGSPVYDIMNPRPAGTIIVGKRVCLLYGAILEKWKSLGGREWDIPVTDEKGFNDFYEGRYVEFQKNVIVWQKLTEARALHGPILYRWVDLLKNQAAGKFIGYPTSDIGSTAGNDGWWLQCGDGAAIVLDGSSQQAFSVHGRQFTAWGEQNYERGPLGYPTTQVELSETLNSSQDFENGTIVGQGNSTKILYQNHTMGKRLIAGHVGSNMELIIQADGYWSFKTHTHTSGFFGDNFTNLAWITLPSKEGPNKADIIYFKTEGHVGGTTSPDSRDEDFSIGGKDDRIAANWKQIRNAEGYFKLRASVAPADVISGIFEAAIVAFGVVVGAIFAAKASEKGVKAEPYVEPDGSGGGVVLPSR